MVIPKQTIALVLVLISQVSCARQIADDLHCAGLQIDEWVHRNAKFLEVDIARATRVFDSRGLVGAPRKDCIRRGLMDRGWLELNGNAVSKMGEEVVKVELKFYRLPANRRKINTELDNWDLVVVGTFFIDGEVHFELETGFPDGGPLISEITAYGPF